MWGLGGRYYWGRKENREKVEGIVVVFAWMSSQERHVNNYVQLYSSLGWNSLICHSQFLNLFFPEKATALAIEILNELIEEVRIRPCPIVFSSFSGGPKACMYKVLQIIEGMCDSSLNMHDCQMVRSCMSGHIYDSSPVDFTSDLGTRFLLHPSILKMSHPPRIASWIANGVASGLDTLFLNRFESQRAEYWQTLYSSVSMGAPYLILCSENDDLAPYHILCNFAQRIKELGGDVKLVTWNGSPHVGHYLHYPIDYKAAVTELLGKAAAVYSKKNQNLLGARMVLEESPDEMSEHICNSRTPALNSNYPIKGFAAPPSDQLLLPNSMEYYDGRDVGSIPDEQKEDLIQLSSIPSINPHGVLGQILFDVCVPKNVEGWDIRSSSLNRHQYTSRRHVPFNPIKCILRSRL